MEPVRGRRVRPLRASLSEFFGTPVVQGEPFHIIHGSPAAPLGMLTTAVEGTVVGVVEAVQQAANAERQAEERLFRYVQLGPWARDSDGVWRRGPYQGG